MTDVQVHPLYARTDKELDDTLASTRQLSDEELAEALRILSAELSSEKSTEKIRAEITKLAQQALSIDNTFDSVSALLKKICEEATNPKMRTDVEALLQTWQGYRKGYTELLWRSREVAGKAQAAATDFASDFVVFLKDVEVSNKEKRSEIDNYLKKVKRDSQASEGVRKGFLDLRQNIRQFAKDWRDVVNKYKPDDGDDECSRLSNDIQTLTITLWILRVKIARLTKSMGVIISTEGVSSILASLCPGFWSEAIQTVLNRGPPSSVVQKATADADGLEREIEQKAAQRDAAALRVGGASALSAHVDAGHADLGDFCARLAAIGSVWATLEADLTTISELLDYTKGQISSMLFNLRLDTLATLYKVLADALYYYQNAVNPDLRLFQQVRDEL